MRTSTTAARPRRRAFNLTLNPRVVEEARHYTSNLSATLDTLLLDFVSRQRTARSNRQAAVDASVDEWNALHDDIGSFADNHSTL